MCRLIAVKIDCDIIVLIVIIIHVACLIPGSHHSMT